VFHARTKHIEVHYHCVRERLFARRARSIWHMCKHMITLLIFSQRHCCLVRSLKLFAKLWAYYHLWIDHPYDLALLYFECQFMFTASLPGGICCHVMVVMCVNTLRTAEALFPSLRGFFHRALYIRSRAILSLFLHTK